MELFTIPELDLTIFDGDGGAAGGSGGAAGTNAAGTIVPSGTAGGAEQARRRMRPGERKMPEETGQTGAQGDPGAAAAQQTEQAAPAAQEEQTKDKRAQFEALMKGEYKQEFTDYFNQQFNRRYAEAKSQLDAQLAAREPLMRALSSLYGVEDGDPEKLLQAVNQDETIWRERAEAAGMTVDQFRQIEQLKERNRAQAEQLERMAGQEEANRQYAAWLEESKQVAAAYPDFDLRAELDNATFRRLLTAGFPMRNAYESVHHAELLEKAVMDVRSQTERAVTSNIQARGARPVENGIASKRGTPTAADVHGMTRKQRAEAAKRMIAGLDPGF